MKPPLSSTGQGSSAICRAAGLIAAFCAAVSLLSIMVLMLLDVSGRYLFNSPVPGAAEIIELAMGITVFSALPLVTARNEHIRLDYLSQALHGRVQAFTNAIVGTISTAGMGLLAWRIAEKALTLQRYGDTTPFLRIPISPIAWFITVCAAAAALIFLWHALRFWYQAIAGASHPDQEGHAS
ncbi:TRAP transporter small permease [Pusillimonas sp. CC-YST705]|uniref:TRAP transporter small permease protein n=1 Tax=Mesopusillimonas faecipullorum TaxID=2755040 RepID=A0ABS8CE14_9BURK|nr:TRAP transporter small permease [Mesopusillimonas faecipullorum]MCB5364274.1 TRAP transporter small permease [Mesopusillimonas faecipullorum]